MSNELNPCPFCGAKPYISQGETKYYLKHKDECYFYGKHNHGVQLVAFANDSDVIASWNTHPIEDALQSRIEELEKAAIVWHRFIEGKDEPSESGYYLTLQKISKYHSLVLTEHWVAVPGYWGTKTAITHWAYLPAPPKEEE